MVHHSLSQEIFLILALGRFDPASVINSFRVNCSGLNIVLRTLLSCVNGNSTWNGVVDGNENVLQVATPSLRIIYRIVVPTVVASGIFGNILVLAVLSTPAFRGIAYLYLRGLALAHIGVLVSWIPILVRLGHGMKNNYPSVFYHAHLELVAVNTFSTASVLIMACLIVDRYIFIFFPARIRGRNARKNVRSSILCSFILGFAVTAPLTGMRMVHEQQGSTGVLFVLRENTSVTGNGLWHGYIWIMEIVTRLCPTMILLLLNTVVVRRFLHLNAKKKEFQLVSEKYRTANVPEASLLTRCNRGYREEQHLATLMSVMAVCFMVTMIPSILVPLLYHNCETRDVGYHLFRAYAAAAELCNYAVYVVIYFSCSTEFREEFVKVIQNKCGRDMEEEIERPIGEIEDYSRHGTTIRLTPEQTKLNSPGSASKLNPMEEDKESELLNASDII
ncbi:probable G-protein coupled receptor B0563.6 isoform X1 [Hylaeus anthracinus]|uniref:probable G-protein coupled receptor B0563.6 isoform X1 n=1 Tax=Hylaeus anthracinus TaxID=313031 RepID=UPI0023B928C5|nr:probable G-protein coupled receptor B0563.6 isoform X1 [Hylaeus anthracinus]